MIDDGDDDDDHHHHHTVYTHTLKKQIHQPINLPTYLYPLSLHHPSSIRLEFPSDMWKQSYPHSIKFSALKQPSASDQTHQVLILNTYFLPSAFNSFSSIHSSSSSFAQAS